MLDILRYVIHRHILYIAQEKCTFLLLKYMKS